MTEKTYQKERYLKEMDAVIVQIEGKDLILDRTIFASDAGGQPCDLGTINDFPVEMVTEKGEEIIHTLSSEEAAASLHPGDQVHLKIDWNRRLDHMQNHLGEHILSGIFKSVYDLDNKGFHLGETDGTFDLDTQSLTPEMIEDVEDRANQAVYDALPVNVEWIQDLKEAEKYPLRKELTVDEDIIVVTVPGVDCVACCCPHLSDTSQIGLIKITGVEKYKKLTRLHFKCGRRALLDYRQKHNDVAILSERYSADEFTLIDKIDKVEQKNDRIRKEYNDFKSSFAVSAARTVLQEAGSVAFGKLDGDMDFLRTVSKKFTELSDLPAVLCSETAGGVLLIAPKGSPIQCGSLVKEFAVDGKGGGGQAQAQVTFADPENAAAFAEKAVEEMKKLV